MHHLHAGPPSERGERFILRHVGQHQRIPATVARMSGRTVEKGKPDSASPRLGSNREPEFRRMLVGVERQVRECKEASFLVKATEGGVPAETKLTGRTQPAMCR